MTRRATKAVPDTAIEPVRNPTATTAGTGLAIVLAWGYNEVLAPHYQLTPMPEAVIIILSMFILDTVRFILTRNKVVEPIPVEPEPEAPRP